MGTLVLGLPEERELELVEVAMAHVVVGRQPSELGWMPVG
jgi:hypothetical protein